MQKNPEPCIIYTPKRQRPFIRFLQLKPEIRLQLIVADAHR